MSRLLFVSVACASACFITGSVALQATSANNFPLARILSTATITLGMAGLLFGAAWIYAIIARRRDLRNQEESLLNAEAFPEYVARYSQLTRASVVALALSFLPLIGFFAIRARWAGAVIAVMFFLLLIGLGAEYLFTSVRFSAREVEYRSAFRGNSRTDWRDVTEISAGPARVTIHSRAGTKIHLRPGLGDPDQVMAQIRNHCRSVRIQI